MHLQRLSYFFLLLFFVNTLTAAQQKGELQNLNIPAPSLEGNLLGSLTTQPIAVYLPPDYKTSAKKYPVVYFLGGYGDKVEFWVNGTYQGFRIKDVMDRLISNNTISQFIVVIIAGYNFLGGSFYVNSTVTGKWEDFVVNDVVGFIDSNFRTIKDRGSRGLSGHSMGGFGTVNLAMLHPDVFGAVYALSPGLYSETGLKTSQIFSSNAFISKFIQKQNEFSSMTAADAMNSYKTFINTCFSSGDWDTPFSYAYGSAFSPNPENKIPYINYPYTTSGSTLVVDSSLLKAYDKGFGNLAEKVKTHKADLLSLNAFSFEVGTNDEYLWIRNGCSYFDQLLKDEGIPHEFTTFQGSHQDIVGQRFEKYLLPSLSKALKYDTLATGIKNESSSTGKSLGLINYPNPFNPATTIFYSIPERAFVSLKIADILGRDIELLANYQEAGKYNINFNAGGLSAGIYFIRLQADQQVYVKKCVLMK